MLAYNISGNSARKWKKKNKIFKKLVVARMNPMELDTILYGFQIWIVNKYPSILF